MFIQSDNRSIFYLFLWFFENCFCLVDSLLIVFKTAFTSFRNLFIFLLKTIFSSVNSQVTRNLFYSFHNLLVFQHSHKKRKDILETRAVYVEISLVFWYLTNGPKHRGSIDFRKIPDINASFAAKYVHLQDWSLKFRQNCKDVPTKILKSDVKQNSS